MKLTWITAAMAATFFLGVSTGAQSTTLTAAGRITSITTLVDGQTAADAAGSIAIGDQYTLSASFDLGAAQLTSLFAADPTINIYYLPGATISYTIGTFRRTLAPQSFNASVQLWNDRAEYGLQPTDAQSFLFFDYPIVDGNLPFSIGSGAQSLSVNVNAFDFSATARDDDSLSFAPFSAFPDRLLSLGQLNLATSTFVGVYGTVDSVTLSAVPEPGAWTLMLAGFSVTAIALRRRRPGTRHAMR